MEYASSDARRSPYHWTRRQNEVRSRSALGNRTPLTAFGRSPGSTAAMSLRRRARPLPLEAGVPAR